MNTLFGHEKTNKHKHFRQDGVRDKPEPSLGQMGPRSGTKWDPSLGQTGLSLFNFTVKSPFCPVCPWDGWGFVPGTIVPQGPSEKCLCAFCLLVFSAPIYGLLAAVDCAQDAIQNRLQWGRSNLVDPAGSPKIRLLNRDLGNFLSIFPRKNSKTQSSLNLL